MMFQLRPKIATTIATIVSVLSMPISGSAAWNQSCCPPEDCCQQEEVCCKKGSSPLWGLLGAAAVGAAAGAITAASLDNGKGHRGRHGPQGASGVNGVTGTSGDVGVTGPAGSTGPQGGFAVVTNESLIFNFDFTITLNLLAEGSSILTFVQKPDGTVILGTPFSGTSFGQQTTSITISAVENGPVQVGTYHWGYVLPPDGVDVNVTLRDNVTELPDGINVFPDNAGAVIISLFSDVEVQFIHHFSFDVD